MKRKLSTFLRKLDIFSERNEDVVLLEDLRAKFAREPRNIPGRISIFGWDLEYTDGLSLVTCLDVLVIKHWNDFVPENDEPIILDCGANIGISVLNYKRQFPHAKITAFEPDPQIVPLLRRNLQRNGAIDVEIVDAAVWIRGGESKFFCEGADGSRLISDSQFFPASAVVKTVDLRTFVCGEIDLIKMDIEGAEFEVILHLGEKLNAIRNMVVECHINNKKIEPFAKFLLALASNGYNISMNSIGPWRDLIRQPHKLQNEFDQYVLVASWRDNE